MVHLLATINQRIANAAFGDRMPGVVYHQQFRFVPVLIEQDCLVNRTDYIVATMNDKSRDILYFISLIFVFIFSTYIVMHEKN